AEIADPTTLFGSTVGVQPSAGAATREALAFNRNPAPANQLQLYVPLLRDVSAPGLPAGARGTAHTVYQAPAENLRGFYDAMTRQGRIPDGVGFDQLLQQSGIAETYRRRIADAAAQRNTAVPAPQPSASETAPPAPDVFREIEEQVERYRALPRVPGESEEARRRRFLESIEDPTVRSFVAHAIKPLGEGLIGGRTGTSQARVDGGGARTPPPTTGSNDAAPAGEPDAPGGALANIATDSPAAENAATLDRIRNASPAEINEWMESLTVEQREQLPTVVQDAILDNVRSRLSAASANITPTAPAHPLANDPSLQRHGREMLKDITLQIEAGEVSQRVSQHGPFTAVLFDSGNGGLAAAGVAAKLLNDFTGGRVQLVTMGDHQNQPYGSKTEQQITGLVFNAVQAGATLDPDVIAMACNTACIALFRARETNTPVPSNGVPVLNLIDNTSRVVADPANRTAMGERPLILSTQATANSNLYQTLIPQYSQGEVTPYNVGGSDPAVTTPDGRTEIRDLATLVNQLAHRDPAREEEVMNAARHYVAKMPKDMTSMVMCCTHYPELIPFFRKALDEKGMQHVPIFDPMPDQILSIVRTLDQSVAGVQPPAVQRPTGPNAVITSATGRDNPGTQPGSGLRTFEDVFPSVPALTGQDAAVFSGQNFGGDYDPSIVRRFLDGELSAVDAATVGFHGRNLHTFFNPGGARDAATALNSADNVMLLTGFNVPPDPNNPNSVPRPETDGPPGTAALANGLLNMGKQVTIVTDSANRPVVEASLRALGADLANPNLNLVEFNAKGPEAESQARELLARVKPDIVGAIELPGRNAAGERTNMGGIVIDGYNPDLDTILRQAGSQGTTTFGVGDGGNEAGMGNLDLSRVALRTPSVIGADIAVTAENSNLGAYAILAELAGLNGRFDLLLTPEQLRSSVGASVEAGAVDGVSRRNENTVDGFSLGYHERTIEHLNGAVRGTWPPKSR
ncbi:MAG: DUF4392 domain-containing protein, partial [Microvirga sp.]|nr:DUF4392 domain-containing protein [Microvirga sp.]